MGIVYRAKTSYNIDIRGLGPNEVNANAFIMSRGMRFASGEFEVCFFAVNYG